MWRAYSIYIMPDGISHSNDKEGLCSLPLNVVLVVNAKNFTQFLLWG
jgi:hypothetical protein